ncbi:hypothetical protein AGLY_010530 [Aphis glycines]|uniref:Uncharacterized protein n=1 Tax=Aphis glycines TaxID=307491 RepID=A0A6G0TEF0_APHGL|nr:hypothetical protein AGLY_010530 [Aphis glycines]
MPVSYKVLEAENYEINRHFATTCHNFSKIFRKYDGKSVKTEKKTSSTLKTMLNLPDKLEKIFYTIVDIIYYLNIHFHKRVQKNYFRKKIKFALKRKTNVSTIIYLYIDNNQQRFTDIQIKNKTSNRFQLNFKVTRKSLAELLIVAPSIIHISLLHSKKKKSRQVGTALLYIRGWGGPRTRLFETKLMENLVLNFLMLDINTNNFMNFELQNNLQIFMILKNFCQNLNFKC